MTAPMNRRGRRPLGAHVTGYAAVWAHEILRKQADESIRQHLAAGRADTAQSIAVTVAELREAARQWLAAMDGPVSDGGSTDPQDVPVSAVSEPLGGDVPGPSGEVDSRAAAAELGVTSARRVGQLVDEGKLKGRKVQGRWFIDRTDLHRLAADRAATAPGTRKRADHGNE